jgi:hypothetical protein
MKTSVYFENISHPHEDVLSIGGYKMYTPYEKPLTAR